MKLKITILMLFAGWLAANSQAITVDDFQQLKKLPLLQNDKFATDKNNAIIDFMTSAKGLTFMADGKNEATAKDIDGGVSVMVPGGTSFIKISHTQYGSLLWKVPGGKLKKKHHYQASLSVFDPSAPYQQQSQWLVFDINPADAVLTVDSTVYLLRNGYKELELTLGKHTYVVESPFHENVVDSIVLSDKSREVVNVNLAPMHSYISIHSPFEQADIVVDGIVVGKGDVASQRLDAGVHRVQLYLHGNKLYDEYTTIANAEKHQLDIAMTDLTPYFDNNGNPLSAYKKSNGAQQLPMVDIKVTSADPKAKIYVDREYLADSAWQGRLSLGQYALTTINDGKESGITWLILDNTDPQEIVLPVAETNYGLLSISCDVPDAEIYINGHHAGFAPMIISDIDATRSHEITVKKKGFRDASKIVTPNRNQLTKVPFTLKKR